MDILGYLLFGILLVAAFSPNWVGEWLAKVASPTRRTATGCRRAPLGGPLPVH